MMITIGDKEYLEAHELVEGEYYIVYGRYRFDDQWHAVYVIEIDDVSVRFEVSRFSYTFRTSIPIFGMEDFIFVHGGKEILDMARL